MNGCIQVYSGKVTVIKFYDLNSMAVSEGEELKLMRKGCNFTQ